MQRPAALIARPRYPSSFNSYDHSGPAGSSNVRTQNIASIKFAFIYKDPRVETQQLWLKWCETLKEFPPQQAPASYNLTQVMEQIKAGSGHPTE